MLTYLISTTRALMAEAIVTGVIAGYIVSKKDVIRTRILLGEAIFGFLGSVIFAYIRNTSSVIDGGMLNAIIYVTALLSFVVFVVMSLPVFQKKGIYPLLLVETAALGLLFALVWIYALPTVLAYPHQVLLSEKTVISTDFLMAMIGMIFGLILCVVSFLASCHVVCRMSKGRYPLLVAELVVKLMPYLAGLWSILSQRRIVTSNHTMFLFVVFVKNHSDGFVFVHMALVTLVAAALWVASFRQNEPYKNPAEHRLIRAKWRKIRRWATVAPIVFLLAVCNLTVVESMNSKEVTLSPIEETEMDDENVYVSFEQVSDGHLHRFAYESENGTQVRFIVIQKPNSSSYGIGLDACDICGQTGYYEKDGQVICNRCDVVMNISTIGFKGGCNPIVIPYEVRDQKIIVPIAGLLEYESEFE